MTKRTFAGSLRTQLKESGRTTKSAPGKHYRKGMTLEELFKKFAGEDAAGAGFTE